MKHEVVQAVDGCTDTFAEQRYRENEVFGISGFEAIGRVNKSEYDIYNRLYVVLRVHKVPDLQKKTGTKEFEKYIRRVKALEKSSAFSMQLSVLALAETWPVQIELKGKTSEHQLRFGSFFCILNGTNENVK